MQQIKIESPIGPLYLVSSDKGLQGIFICRQDVPTFLKTGRPKPIADAAEKILDKAAKQLSAYFKGQLKEFELPLDPQGTAFQKSVWRALSEIRYGETCSYKDIAKRIKNPKAVRAVGQTNGRNPLCIVIPCHRVIAADGSLGGYSSGLDIKTQLLDLERRNHG